MREVCGASEVSPEAPAERAGALAALNELRAEIASLLERLALELELSHPEAASLVNRVNLLASLGI